MTPPRPPVRLTARGRACLYVVAFGAAIALGFADPVWSAMPWSVTP